MVLHGIALHLMILHSLACHCIVSYGVAGYCIVGFGARAVSRKTPTYFILDNSSFRLNCLSQFLDFGPKNCFFGPKFCIFLRYTYETPSFSGQTHRTGLITCPPYPTGTLDTFGFPVGGRFSAPIAQSGPFWAQKRCFRPEIKNGPKIRFLCFPLYGTAWNCFVSYGTP